MELDLISHRSLTEHDTELNRDHELNSPPPKDYKSPQITTRTSFWSWTNKHWVWEIASCIGSLVALICIIVVLFNYDGKPIPDWPYGTTINSVLSWITQVFNALILGTIAACLSQMAWVHLSASDHSLSDINSYHWASRGVVGSIALVWGSRMRHWASLGALITILAIAVGPFVQQMSTVQNTRLPVSFPASVGRGQTYLEQTKAAIEGQQPTSGMLAALYSSLFGSQESIKAGNSSAATHPNVPVTCPSGECDFPLFRSLAVCSECYDISSTLLSRCEKGFSCLPDNKAQCLHSLPNGVQVNMSDYILLGGTYLRTNSTPPTLEMHKQARLGDYGESKIVSMTEIKIPSQANLTNAIASYCVLYWCVNTYSAAVRNHTLFENVTDTWHDASAQIDMIEPGESRLDLQPPREDNLTQFSFTVNGWASSTIGSWLKDKMEISNVPDTHCYGNQAGMGSTMEFSTEFLLPMLRSSLTDIFKSLANGMTVRIRQLDSSAQNDTPNADFGPVEGIGSANGTSFIVKTQIHVRWAWIILPCLLLILTMAFLGITIFETRKMGLEAWKSSPTALVCSGLDDSVQQEIRAARDPVKMEELAAEIPVRLRRRESVAPNEYWKLESS